MKIDIEINTDGLRKIALMPWVMEGVLSFGVFIWICACYHYSDIVFANGHMIANTIMLMVMSAMVAFILFWAIVFAIMIILRSSEFIRSYIPSQRD